MTGQVFGIHHVSVLVSNTKRACCFYRDVLNIREDHSRPELGYPGAWLEVGDQQIHLLELPDPCLDVRLPVHGGRDRHIALKVSNLSLIKTVLDKLGVSYTLSKSGRRAIFFRDPDGNALECIETTLEN